MCHALLAAGLAQPSPAGSTSSLGGWGGTQGKPIHFQQQQGTVGRAVNHPGQASRNDSHSLLEPVASQSQRAFVLINTRPERRGKPEGEERLRRLCLTLREELKAWVPCVLPFLSHCFQSRDRVGKKLVSSPTSARMGLRPPKVSKEIRPLDFSKRGLWLQTPQPKALEDQSSGGDSCTGLRASPWNVPGPGATPCLSVIPAGPHLILLLSLTLSELAQPVAKDSPHLTFRALRSGCPPRLCQPLCRATQVSQASSSLHKLSWLPGSGSAISCLVFEVCFGHHPGNC